MKFVKNKGKIAIYSRKSKFTGKGESIENQIALCKNEYEHKTIKEGLTISDEDFLIFEDEGYSGKNIERPQFKAMMKAVRAGEVSTIICYRLDRISRNTGDFAKLHEELESLQVEFISVKDNFDTSTPTGKAMMLMVSVFSQLERETIAERIRDNMHELAKSGRWLGGNTPTGYKSKELVGSITKDGKPRTAFKLDIIKEEADIVKTIFEKFLEFNSLSKVETYMLQNHIKTKNNVDFKRFTIRGILTNPVYMIADISAWEFFQKSNIELYAEESNFSGTSGVMAYNKTNQAKGGSNIFLDMNEWIIAVGKHKGIINGSDWVRVQEMLGQNKSKSYRKPKSNEALLSGLLFCKDCGSFMRPKKSKRYNKDGALIYDYLCETKEKSKSKNCAMKRPNGNVLDKTVCEEIKKLSENSSAFIKELEKARKKFKGNSAEYENRLTSLRKSLSDKENEINMLVSSIANSAGTPAYDYITKQINENHEKVQSIRQSIEELENLTQNQELSDNEFEIMKEMLSNFGKSFETMSVEQKRTALRMFIKRIEWDGENIHLYLFGSDGDLPDFPDDDGNGGGDDGFGGSNGSNNENISENGEKDTPISSFEPKEAVMIGSLFRYILQHMLQGGFLLYG